MEQPILETYFGAAPQYHLSVVVVFLLVPNVVVVFLLVPNVVVKLVVVDLDVPKVVVKLVVPLNLLRTE